MDRDTQKCAYKCSHAVVNGKEVNVFKSPITDLGKKSKKGRLTLEIENGQFVTKEEGTGSSDKVQQFMYMHVAILPIMTSSSVMVSLETTGRAGLPMSRLQNFRAQCNLLLVILIGSPCYCI